MLSDMAEGMTVAVLCLKGHIIYLLPEADQEALLGIGGQHVFAAEDYINGTSRLHQLKWRILSRK